MIKSLQHDKEITLTKNEAQVTAKNSFTRPLTVV